MTGLIDICDATTSMNTFSDSDAYMSMVTLAARSAFAAALKEDSPLRMSEMIGRELSRLAAFEENSDVVSENPGSVSRSPVFYRGAPVYHSKGFCMLPLFLRLMRPAITN